MRSFEDALNLLTVLWKERRTPREGPQGDPQ